jgi:peptidyl-prolyl cis-trans isomerase SurA
MTASRCVFVLLIMGFCAGSALAEVVEQIVAIVGETPILLSELEEALAFARAAGDTSADEELRRTMLRQLIEDRAVVEAAKREDIEAPAREVEEEAARREKELRGQFADPGGFSEQLRREGLTEAQFRRLQEDMARDQLLARKLLETVRPSWKVTVTDAEVDSFYQANLEQLPVEPVRVRLCHLLVSFGEDPEATDSILTLAQTLKERAEAGEEFASLAREFGAGPSAPRGGDLGFLVRGQVVPEFEEAVFSLRAGEVGGPVRTRLGYHVVKVEEIQGDRVRARHILLPVATSDAQRETRLARADSLWRVILEGASFDDVVAEASDDTTTRGEGGCIGTVRVPSLPAVVQETVDTLGVDQVSAPVQLDDGFHLYAVRERVPAGPASIEEIGPRIRLVLQQTKLEEKYREWVSDLKDGVYIHVFEEHRQAASDTGGS